MVFGLSHAPCYSKLAAAYSAPYWPVFLASFCAGTREHVEHALFVKEEEEEEDIFGT